MAKAIALYVGYDSFGRDVQVAQRVDGLWWERHAIKTRFGLSRSPWSFVPASEIKHPTHLVPKVEYAGAPKVIQISEEDRTLYLEYGFNILRKCDGHYTLRLPN